MAVSIPRRQLEKWARQKYNQHRSTMELMAEADTLDDRSVIAIIALLEVESPNRYRGLRADESRYIHYCHDYLSSIGLGPDINLDKTA